MSEASINWSRKMPWSTGETADNSALNEIPASLLLVDDDPGILLAMASLLEGPGRTVLTAQTGQDALRHLLRHDCAVIVLDVRMPQMDGFELATMIRKRDRFRFTPIIFLSGVDTMDAHVVRGLSSGAVDYLVKPVQLDILRHKVDAFIELFRLREWAQQQARRQSEERFRQLVEGIEDYAIFLVDIDVKVATWNI
jgi:DNA-binding response OmpR family regulator